MRVHLIGIGGTGMGALAGLLVEAGHEVRGSDGPLYPPMSTLLQRLGVPLYQGYRPQNLDWGPDAVVVGNICRRDHPEASVVLQRGIRRVSFPGLLSELFLEGRQVVVVAGTHGKTTTASLLAHTMTRAGLEPGFLVGGIPRDLDRSYALGRPPCFVVEGDEYDCAFFDKRPKFVHYRPRTAILTGVEFDHADIYPTMAEVEAAFAMLVERVPAEGRLLVCADSEVALRLCRQAACPVESYSVRGEAHWQGRVTATAPGRQALEVSRAGERVCRVELGMTGRHNMENALAVAAVALGGLGLEPAVVQQAMGSFSGVRRRQEVRGVAGGVTVIDDFAHHPTAVRETLAGLRGVHGPGALVAVFEPRSATSRRSVFQKDFARALGEADRVLLASTLHDPGRIPPEQRLDPARLVRQLNETGTEALLLPGVEQMLRQLARSCRPGDTVVVMSSGGFGGLPDRLLAALEDQAD